MAFATNLSRFSIIPAIAMHLMFNTVSRFLNGLFTKVQPSTRVPFEMVMGMCGIGTAAVLVILAKGRLAYHAESGSEDSSALLSAI